MIVVLSDLHFKELNSTLIPGMGPHPSPNLPPRLYRKFINRLAEEARRNNAKRMDLVLAGDIFELVRTALWYDGEHRPYISNRDVDPVAEAKIIGLLDAIAADPDVAETLEIFRSVMSGEFRGLAGVEEVTLHYLPGNHDRLANATSAIRQKVRALLGLPGVGDPFPHYLLFSDPAVLIRHGHEYDRINFSEDLRGAGKEEDVIPLELPEEQYDEPCIGDFVANNVAARFPHLFREIHGKEQIVQQEEPSIVYRRLLEFDDLRPQSALYQFLLALPGVSQKTVWKLLAPVFKTLLDEMRESDFFNKALKQLDEPWKFESIDVLQFFLLTKSWKWMGVRPTFARIAASKAFGHQEKMATASFAAREELVLEGKVRFVVAGHTHRPDIELIRVDDMGPYLFVDTGTWCTRILSTPDRSGFFPTKAMSFVTIYGSEEDKGTLESKLESIDFWINFTQRLLPSF